jgi:molybdenum cofactor cytidylyltransferase
LKWQGEPLVKHVVRLAVESELHQILLITGSDSDRVETAVTGLPVTILQNPDWTLGQGSSIRVGVNGLEQDVSACLFFMCDQPLIKKELVTSLLTAFIQGKSKIIAPIYQGQRGNPVLFDRSLFPELSSLADNEGGKSLFSRYPVSYVESPDNSILIDIDTLEDYQKLSGGES